MTDQETITVLNAVTDQWQTAMEVTRKAYPDATIGHNSANELTPLIRTTIILKQLTDQRLIEEGWDGKQPGQRYWQRHHDVPQKWRQSRHSETRDRVKRMILGHWANV